MTALWFLRANLLLIVAALGVEALAKRRRLPPAAGRRAAHGLLAAALVLPLLPRILPERTWERASIQVWAAPTMKSFTGATPTVSVPTVAPEAPADRVRLFLWLWIGAGLSRLLLVGFRLGRLSLSLREAHPMRKLGRVRIRCSARFSIPFSWRGPGGAWVVLPETMLAGDWGQVVRHELQHHRSRDTIWVWLLEAVRCLFLLNPAAWRICRRIDEFHELACDEALIGRGAVEPQAYGRCLIRVAETALTARAPSIPACAAGITQGASSRTGAFLKRRVLMLFETKTAPSARFGRWGAVALFTLLAGASVASENWIRDRRITLEQARAWMPPDAGEFPYVLNARVLKQLNRFLGTPDGREFFRRALARKQNYDRLLDDKLAEYGVPRELLAVALVESGYKNAPPEVNPVRAAGVWQFMAQTARNYNLRVDDRVDERMNVEKETDAAFRLLKALKLRFMDWGLALLAFNAGEEAVQRGIRVTGSRDVWTLIAQGHFNDAEYVERVFAAALILKNPASLD